MDGGETGGSRLVWRSGSLQQLALKVRFKNVMLIAGVRYRLDSIQEFVNREMKMPPDIDWQNIFQDTTDIRASFIYKLAEKSNLEVLKACAVGQLNSYHILSIRGLMSIKVENTFNMIIFSNSRFKLSASSSFSLKAFSLTITCCSSRSTVCVLRSSTASSKRLL